MRIAQLYPNDARKNERELPKNTGAISCFGMPIMGKRLPNTNTATTTKINPSTIRLLKRVLITRISRAIRARKIVILEAKFFTIFLLFVFEQDE